MDIVAHNSAFCNYLQPASDQFWGKPAASLAVSGLKVWWFDQCPRSDITLLPGCSWEDMVLFLDLSSSGQSGLMRFLAVVKKLARGAFSWSKSRPYQ